MTTKEEVLKILNENSDRYISGQDIADSIHITRAGVWKAIKSLEKDGVNIEAVTNRGYRILKKVDVIDPEYIAENLDGKVPEELTILYINEVDSTNDELKRRAELSNEMTLLIANKQHRGKGRRGREFFSPEGSGLYMSLLMFPGKMENVSTITGIAAVAVATAIDEIVYGTDKTKIKWVNDIFVDNKKVSGILTEAFTCQEDEDSNYIIIGIGINVYSPYNGFPKEIKRTAGYLIDGKMSEAQTDMIRNKLAARIVENLFFYYNKPKKSISLYRKKSNLIGNYIKINSFKNTEKGKKYALVKGISDKYHLMIEYEDGASGELSSGEVSVVKY